MSVFWIGIPLFIIQGKSVAGSRLGKFLSFGKFPFLFLLGKEIFLKGGVFDEDLDFGSFVFGLLFPFPLWVRDQGGQFRWEGCSVVKAGSD